MDMRAVLGLIILALIFSGCAGAPQVPPQQNQTPPGNSSNQTISNLTRNSLAIERLNTSNLAQGEAFIHVQNPELITVTANIYTGYACAGNSAYWAANGSEVQVHFTHELPKGMACATVLEARTYSATLDLSKISAPAITRITVWNDGQLVQAFDFAGMFCGGLAAFQCPANYNCILDGTYPDAGGKCVPAVCGGPQKITCPDGYNCQALTRCGSSGTKCGPDSEGKCIKKGISPELPPAGYCETAADCVTGGCSGQVCQTKAEAANGGGITTCEWREEYSCYKAEGCGCSENRCSWSAEVQNCVSQKQLPVPPDYAINAKAGEEFSIPLYSSPSTGYSWSVTIDNNSVVEYLGYSSDNCANYVGVVGAGCDMSYKFKALSKGTAKMMLVYARPWESTVPAEVRTVAVVVS